MINEKDQIKFNVGIVGNSNVGKTCLLQKLIDKNFDLTVNKPKPTIFISPSMYITSSNGKRIQIQFFDTAGTEKYHSAIWSNLKSACAFLIVFDLTDEVSFDDVIYWKDQIKEHVDLKKVDIIMVANKCDLERKVSTNRIENFEKKNDFGTNYLFFETSALTGEGINECLEGLVNKILYRYENLTDKKTINQNIKLNETKIKKKSWCCLFN